jgi:uncharacterized metal-binding protein YceD (DUF177 family)
VQKPSFAVRLADLERGSKKLTFELGVAWLTEALSDANASPQGPGEATVELTKTGGLVVVRGHARAKITVPCVVTLDPVELELAPEIVLQLSRDPDAPERGKGPPKAEGTKPEAKKKSAKSPGQHADRRLKDDPELGPDEAAADFYRGEEVVLDDFIREFLLLEIPPYPRRSDLPSPEESISSRPLADASDASVEAKPLDPRLAPLLGIASRLKGSANKE